MLGPDTVVVCFKNSKLLMSELVDINVNLVSMHLIIWQ